MSQRAYCDRDHPGSDAEADRWCEDHHRVELPRQRVDGVLSERECDCQLDALGYHRRRCVADSRRVSR